MNKCINCQVELLHKDTKRCRDCDLHFRHEPYRGREPSMTITCSLCKKEIPGRTNPIKNATCFSCKQERSRKYNKTRYHEKVGNSSVLLK